MAYQYTSTQKTVHINQNYPSPLPPKEGGDWELKTCAIVLNLSGCDHTIVWGWQREAPATTYREPG